MRNRSLLVVVLSASACLTALNGCGRRENERNPDLQAAMHLIDQANQGFLSVEAAKEPDPPTLEQYRQQTLKDALPRLHEAIKSGSPAEQVIARRLLADVQTVAARHTAGQAGLSYTKLSAISTDLIAQLSLVDQFASQAELFSHDRTEIKEALENQIKQQQTKRDEVQASIDELTKKIDDLQRQRESLLKEAKAARAQQFKLQNQAYDVEGKEHYDLLDDAAKAERESVRKEAEADKLQAQIEPLQAAQAVQQSQLKVIDQTISEFQGQLKDWQKNKEDRQQRLAQVEEQRVEAAKRIVDQFAAMHQRLVKEVHEPYLAAADRMQKAVDELDKAVGQAKGEALEATRYDLLAARSTQVDLLAEHVKVAGSMGQTAEILARRASKNFPPQVDASVFTNVRDDLAQTQQKLIDQIDKLAQEGLTLADQLSSASDEQVSKFAQQKQAALSGAAMQVHKYDLK